MDNLEDAEDLDDEEVIDTIRRHARQLAIQSGGKAQFRDVMLSLGKELDREKVRSLIPTIKQEIEGINNKSLEELKKLDEESDEGLVENEYDELVQLCREKFDSKPYVKGLIAYGSFGKGNHIMGQSNLNFLLILKDFELEEEEHIGKEIQSIIESLMNPLFEYLLDIVILFQKNVKSIDEFTAKMGPGFSMIHAFSVSHSVPILGTNPFKEFDFKGKLAASAKLILQDTMRQYQKAIEELNALSAEDSSKTREDLAYLSSEAIIDYALALIYYFAKTPEHITKPDVRDKFPEILGKSRRYHTFLSTVEKAFAYRMGVTRIGENEEILDDDLINECHAFTKALAEEFTGA